MTGNTSTPGMNSIVNNFGLTVLGEDGNSVPKTMVNRQASPTLPPVGSINTAKHLYQGPVDSQDRWTWIDKVPEDVEEAAENEETARHALVVRNKKSSDSRKKFEVDSIVIQSPWLKKALDEILKDYPGVYCGLDRLVFEAPFEPFVHRWGDLLDFMTKEHDDKTAEHLKILHSVLKEELRDTIQAFEDYVAHGVVTFKHVWTIFQPGGVVISHSHGGTTVAVEFQSGAYEDTRCGKVYALTCQSVDWNGEFFGKGVEYIQLPAFVGTRPIKSLHAYPLPFYTNSEGLRALLIERGKKFEALVGCHYRAYDGYALGRDREGKEIRLNVTGRIIIDAKSWNRNTYDGDRYLEPLNLSEDGGDTESDLDHATGYTKDGMIKLPSVESGKEPARLRLREEHHLICSPRVKGFSFKLKQWQIVEFFVDLTAQIQWNTHAFDKLVLPPDQKELLLSFAESQVTDKALFDDIIEGKGKGIIILLSGPPGVGKTLTAESIAENMHAPLYMISAGDLGVTPEQIEYKLTNILSMIASWNSVLLLDECDVFLEARSAHDLERNKLVSIFLRVLEYYEGILFLTTNRIDNIDPAFQSRIHVSMAYPELNAKSQRHIWANFLEGRKGGDSAAHEFTEQDLDELAEVGLNGRQIKNVLKTAQLLASQKKCPLRREFVETVLAIERRRPGIP